MKIMNLTKKTAQSEIKIDSLNFQLFLLAFVNTCLLAFLLAFIMAQAVEHWEKMN